MLLLLVIALAIAADRYIRGLGPRAKQRVVAALQQRFDADVDLKSLQVSLFPQPSVTGEGLSIRHKQWPDPRPLIYVASFTARTDFRTLIDRRNHVDLVRLQGLEIHIPPRGRASNTEVQEDLHQVAGGEPGHDTARLTFLIETIVADGALLEIQPKVQGKRALRFDIENLRLQSVAPGQPMAFTAKLTNAKPPGIIDSSGNFGPWQRDDPRATPVSGSYNFQNANLGVFKGISGILASTGKYSGVLQHIEINGATDTPNFALKRGGQPVHLTTTFHSIVNGTDGDTILDPVDARFLKTEFLCQGGVVHVDDTPGKTVSLDAVTKEARMEDILHLVMGDSRPLLTGAVDFKTKIVIPPGSADVLDKLQLDGQFGIVSAQFTSQEMQHRLLTLSDRARGITKKEEAGQPQQTVASNLNGHFKLEAGVVSFSRLGFSVPGAAINLAGNYNLRSGTMDMDGTFRMQATLADTQSGVKHWLLKPLDPFFEKGGAGFLVPIKITGTRDHPEIGTTIFHHAFTIH
ncbi:MAG TPA: AsmA-like C-terminal region-containing protein [Bryobacteraceae bacterium]|nr:AsmA-like C-terminal region-containing protein [Bryobacteraceae bacterium]